MEKAGGDAAAVEIENGTPNYVLEEAPAEEEGEVATLLAVPTWQDIEGATESEYLLEVTEESADAEYRCVITIEDEVYFEEARQQPQDSYGADFIEELEEEGEVPLAEEMEAEVETELITPPIALALPQNRPLMRATAMPVRLESGFIVGIDTSMEYITADTLAQHPDAKDANHQLWTFLGAGLANRTRPDGSTYLQAGLTDNNKLPVLPAGNRGQKNRVFQCYNTGAGRRCQPQKPGRSGLECAHGYRRFIY